LKNTLLHFNFFVSVDLLFTSRVLRSLLHCNLSSPCNWISSQTRYAQCRMLWKVWWQESLSRVIPQKPSKRCVLLTPFYSRILNFLKGLCTALALQIVTWTLLL